MAINYDCLSLPSLPSDLFQSILEDQIMPRQVSQRNVKLKSGVGGGKGAEGGRGGCSWIISTRFIYTYIHVVPQCDATCV